MARVVQQHRSGPPYLLILFVFLFLVSTAVAVLVYLNGDKDRAARVKDENLLAAFQKGHENDSDIQDIIGNFNRDANVNPSVVTELRNRNRMLTQLVTGMETGDAKGEAQKAFDRLKSQPGLAQAVVDLLDNRIPKLNNTIKEKGDEIASLKSDMDARKKADDDAEKKMQGERTDLNKKIADLDEKLKAVQADRQKQVDDLTAENQKKVGALEKDISDKAEKIIRLGRDVTVRDQRIAELEGKLNKPQIGKEDILTRQPNGKVVRTGGAETVYINLGSKDKLKPGMTFSVYPGPGIPRDSNQFTAKVIVTSVFEESSACRITLLNNKDVPVTPGEVIFNAAYDPSRSYKFVVIGLFDIYNTRKPDAQGAEEVKNLITRYGGVVQPEVTPDTDYLVVGEEPALPKAAAGTGEPPPLPPELQKARDAYQAALKASDKLRLQVLNTNRFLELTGFEPTANTGK